MEREMIVLVEDIKDKENYGFMASPTPRTYIKKTKKQLKIEEQQFVFLNHDGETIEEINIQEIQKATISLCSRIVASTGMGGGLRTIVHVDMDLMMKNGDTYSYEVVRPDTFEIVFSALHHNHVEVDDRLGVEKVYTDMEYAGQRSKYLTGNFGKMARKYKLDHPRRN